LSFKLPDPLKLPWEFKTANFSATSGHDKLPDGCSRYWVDEVLPEITPQMLVWWFSHLDGDTDLEGHGDEAIALANVLSLDVIALDVGLSSLDGFDGFEVARRLRASSRTSTIPIVLLSAYKGPRDIAKVRASGCEGHLVKPCSADALLGLIADLALSRRDRVDSGAARTSIG
jgi:CheY-like chemotaxis protein